MTAIPSPRDGMMVAGGFNPQQNPIHHTKCAAGSSSARESFQTLLDKPAVAPGAFSDLSLGPHLLFTLSIVCLLAYL